jgi:hypothetical protein
VNFGTIRVILSGSVLPVLVRTSRTPGYYMVEAASALTYQGARLLPDTDTVNENWLLWTLKPHMTAGASAVTPLPSWELPDLADVTTGAELAAVGASYDSHKLALSLPSWIGVCGDTYRRATMTESTGKQAFVLFFDL